MPNGEDVDASFGPSAVLRSVWTRPGQVQGTCPPLAHTRRSRAHILTASATTIHENGDGTDSNRFPDCSVIPGNPSTEQTGEFPWGFHETKRETTQGVDIDVLDVAAVSRGRGDGAHALAGEQLGGDVLGVRFERRGMIARQWHLAAEELVDAPAQRWPVDWGDLEVSSQIEQGALSHLRAGAFGAHEAEGEIAVADTAGAGASDEHADTIAGVGVGRNTSNIFSGTTSACPTIHQ